MVGDFNGDGKLDFAQAGGGATVFPGNGDGTFGTPRYINTGGVGSFGLASGDFNGDGRPDLAVANTFSNTVGVLLNLGPQPAATVTLKTSVSSPAPNQPETLTATVTSPAGAPPGPEVAWRSLAVLEEIGTPEARQVLEALAKGASGHRLTEQAALSVGRLKLAGVGMP